MAQFFWTGWIFQEFWANFESWFFGHNQANLVSFAFFWGCGLPNSAAILRHVVFRLEESLFWLQKTQKVRLLAENFTCIFRVFCGNSTENSQRSRSISPWSKMHFWVNLSFSARIRWRRWGWCCWCACAKIRRHAGDVEGIVGNVVLLICKWTKGSQKEWAMGAEPWAPGLSWWGSCHCWENHRDTNRCS